MDDLKALQTVGQVLHYSARQLRDSEAFFGHGTNNAWDEAVLLVLSAAELPMVADQSALGTVFPAAAKERLAAWLEKRLQERLPAPYIVGKAWFAGLEFDCDERALIPRSPLAELILDGLQPWYAGPGPERILDLCCGGGCIGLATACYFSEAMVDLVDIDPAALSLAQDNAHKLGVDERVEILRSDLFDAVRGRRYDVILSNPPYVDESDLGAMPREFSHEPALALGSGADGLDITRQILAAAHEYLAPEGLLIVEVGNSWGALEAAYPQVPFTWIEFTQGGHGVFTLTSRELQDYSAYLRG